MTLYCPIGQEILNIVINCCKLLKVNQTAEREVSSTVKGDNERSTCVLGETFVLKKTIL